LQSKGAQQWLYTDEVLEQLGGRKDFHEFVLSGNEEALETFYQSRRHSPVLGRVEFIQKLRGPEVTLSREIPRYQRQGVQPKPEQVVEKVAGSYKLPQEEVLTGVRGKENEARKVAMYLVRRCCDQTLSETARVFGVGSCGAVGWSCHGVKTKMEQEKRFRDRIERIAAEIFQQKI
jgi:chromosomal replication initiation ATPase DnaA